MKLDKLLVDNLIGASRKYYRNANSKALENLFYTEREFLNAKENIPEIYVIKELIIDLAKYTIRVNKGTYQDIYNALKMLGIEVVELW